MRRIHNNWKMIVVVFVFAAASGSAWWHFDISSTTTAEPAGDGEYDAVGTVQREAILGVLGEIDLDRDALVALNLNAAQAEDVLADTRAWYEDNAANLAAWNVEIATRTAAVRALEKSIRMGPHREGRDAQLQSARRTLVAGRQTRQRSLNPLRMEVAVTLSQSQRDTWAIIADGYGSRMPIRMLALTGEQRHDYGKARRMFRLQYSGAENEEQHDEAVATWEAAQGSILTDSNRQVIAAWQEYASDSGQAVAGAMDTVLPPTDADA
ncbi:MAG: hypothetical protein GY842_01660 [bacterium]|nr:hypothetical protein [bacterium]